jgi:plastocyanin
MHNTGSRPLSVTGGPDGNIWFTEADGNAIGRVSIAQPNSAYVLSMDAGFAPSTRIARLGEQVQWTFLGPRVHSAVDASGFALFDSGPRSVVSYFTHTFTSAGTYAYRDGTNAASLGSIIVPVALPKTGTVGQPFLVVWSIAAPPANVVFDVQVETPGSGTFSLWSTTSQMSSQYVATLPGSYRFRARMRDTSTAAFVFYSRPIAIAVN